jgi:3-oxoacyl-[acyl-carrier protein] reductase
MEFKDKVVLITGASRGIGAATALAFAQKGAKVIVDYFVSEIEPDAEENAKKIIETIKTMGQEAIMIEADVRNEEQVKNIINKSVDSFGKIDILVNNAGIVFDENYESKTIEH